MRRRDTISPAAQSIGVTINGAPAAVINRTNSPSQSVSLDAPVGNDAFAFNVYDQANALGHLLGSANVVQQIVDGAANQVAATITAICAATNVSLAAPDPLSYTTFAPSGVYASSMQSIVLAGQTPVGLFGYPEDADGNVIISPPGGKLTATITGSAGLIVNNGYLLHMTPVTGPRSTTPDTLTVAAPSCPSTTVAVSHSPAIYAEDRQYGVGIYDWYGDLLSSGTMASGDVLIGYDSVSHELIARNPTTNTITGYSPDLSIQSSLFTISYLTAAASWANSVNGAFYATEFSDSPNRYNKGYFVSSNGTGTLVGSGVGTSSTVVLGASTFTTSSYGFVSTDGSVSNFNLTVQGNALASNGHDAGTILGLAPDDHNGTLVAFNQSSPYVSVFSENLVGLPVSGDYGITATPFVGAIDTDGDNIYVNTSVNLEASSATGTPLSGFGIPINPGLALVVVSTNEH
jgi:hypothetical protein